MKRRTTDSAQEACRLLDELARNGAACARLASAGSLGRLLANGPRLRGRVDWLMVDSCFSGPASCWDLWSKVDALLRPGRTLAMHDGWANMPRRWGSSTGRSPQCPGPQRLCVPHRQALADIERWRALSKVLARRLGLRPRMPEPHWSTPLARWRSRREKEQGAVDVDSGEQGRC